MSKMDGNKNWERPLESIDQSTECHKEDGGNGLLVETAGTNYVMYELQGGTGPRTKGDSQVSEKQVASSWNTHAPESTNVEDTGNEGSETNAYPDNY